MRTFSDSRSPRGALVGDAVRILIILAAIAIALAGCSATAKAQYFGRNKVQYESFKFEVLRTPHFDVHYYAAEKPAAEDAARMLERWNARYSSLFSHPLSARKPIVLYADQPDFQQTNVISEQLDEGTGGVTESILDRMVLPLTGSYAESDHVLGHEMVHVFQYDIAQSKAANGGSLDRLPMWLVEGMAEYLSIGGEDANTAMWLRDAVLRNDLPTIKQLTQGGKYFPYRYGEALWAYIGGTWGDETVPRLFRSSLSLGFDAAIHSTLGISSDSLSNRWRAAIREQYGPLVQGRARPADVGDRVIFGSGQYGEYEVSPAVSPDGRLVAFFSSRDLTGIDMYLADAVTGKVRAKLAAPSVTSHFDALSFLYSAGSWSPDAKRIAFVTYADGDNEINLMDVQSHKITKHFKPKNIGAVTTLAWSPDGRQLAFSGQQGGLSDLYLYDIASGAIRPLTNDKYADLQPAWSPDGRTIAFATDRPSGSDSAGASTDFRRLKYSALRLALIDVASGQIRVLAGEPQVKHINPQYSADGKSLYYVSDRGGFTDIYRVVLETGETFRVTRAATGVSGVTATSPAISVARENGRLMFSVFDKAGFHISALPAERAKGEPIGSDDTRRVADGTDGNGPDTLIAQPSGKSAAILPADGHGLTSTVITYLHDSDDGLPADTSIVERPYRTAFRLAGIGQPSFGVGSSSVFGTQFSGGVSAFFTDMLGDQSIGASIQASGQLRDIGGQLLYINTGRRWNWGLNASRAPYVYAYGALTNAGAQYVYEHIAIDNLSAFVQYPLSQTRRLEFSTGYTHFGYSIQTATQGFDGRTSRLTDVPAPSPLGLSTASIALVGDASSFGLTSPISGSRYRFEVTPTIGSLDYETVLLDARKYFFVKPFTLAVRGMHYGLYGKDSESDRLGALFLGDGSLVRGYSYSSFSSSDCASSGSGSLATSTCPQFDRLVGSRLALANAELRIPLVGPSGFGLISSMLPPIEIAPFVDAGVAWTKSSSPVLDLTPTSGDRTPVVSTGIASRINLFGFAVFEVYYAHPFQRPGRSGVWGFVLQPGW
jgi:dipeptidyl aminopeptidase/acylaminoacyl peptidase